MRAPWGSRQPEPHFDRADKIYLLALQKGLRSPFDPPDELHPDKKDDPPQDPPAMPQKAPETKPETEGRNRARRNCRADSGSPGSSRAITPTWRLRENGSAGWTITRRIRRRARSNVWTSRTKATNPRHSDGRSYADSEVSADGKKILIRQAERFADCGRNSEGRRPEGSEDAG